MSEAVKQVIWLYHIIIALSKRSLLSDEAIILYENNLETKTLIKELNGHKWSKHIQIQYHAIHDYIVKNDITIKYISTELMLADRLTKAVNKNVFSRMIQAFKLNEI